VTCEQPVGFNLRFRLPWWVSGKAEINVDGAASPVSGTPSSYFELKRIWQQNTVQVKLPRRLVSVPLPDDPKTIGIMDGPVVLAGLNPGPDEFVRPEKSGSEKEYRPNYTIAGLALKGDTAHPETLITPDDEREWSYWRGDYRTVGQPTDFRLIPLHEVREEVYTVYFNSRD
jgi:uncharacterized protein